MVGLAHLAVGQPRALFAPGVVAPIGVGLQGRLQYPAVGQQHSVSGFQAQRGLLPLAWVLAAPRPLTNVRREGVRNMA